MDDFLNEVYGWLYDERNEDILKIHARWYRTMGHDAFINECERFLIQRYRQTHENEEPNWEMLHKCALEYAKGFKDYVA